MNQDRIRRFCSLTKFFVLFQIQFLSNCYWFRRPVRSQCHFRGSSHASSRVHAWWSPFVGTRTASFWHNCCYPDLERFNLWLPYCFICLACRVAQIKSAFYAMPKVFLDSTILKFTVEEEETSSPTSGEVMLTYIRLCYSCYCYQRLFVCSHKLLFYNMLRWWRAVVAM
jgi:hypothetical protein